MPDSALRLLCCKIILLLSCHKLWLQNAYSEIEMVCYVYHMLLIQNCYATEYKKK